MVGRVDDLIEEAREFLVTPNLGKSLMRELDKAMIYLRRLADALEAATRVPVQGEPNGDRCLGCGSAEEDGHDDCTIKVRTFRAAVPDAATEISRNLANATALTGQDARVIAGAAVKVAGEIAEDHARCDGRLLSVEKHAERMEAERDDLATRLSEYLCDSTGGLLSKTGYDVRTMVAHTEEYYDKVHAESRKDIEAERDAALEAIERVRAVHRKFTYYELEDSCPDTSEDHREERHHESDEIGEFYCEDMPTGDVVCDLCRDADGERMDWPCPTVAALDGAPEPEEEP